MRQIAHTKTANEGVMRCMTYAADGGVYLFLYNSPNDCSCCSDLWFETLEAAHTTCQDRYGIATEDWREIPDPLPDSQHDWINNVRMKRDSSGTKVWGQFEQLVDGVWTELPSEFNR